MKDCNILYHYTSPDAILNIIKDNGIQLRFTKFDSLNDYNEGKEVIRIQEIICDELAEIYPDKVKIIEQIKKIKPNHMTLFVPDKVKGPSCNYKEGNIIASACITVYNKSSVPYICSFSKEKDLLPMWNYYSKNDRYEGYNIGINSTKIEGEVLDNNMQIINNPSRCFRIKSVIYKNSKKRELLKKEIINILENESNINEQLLEYQRNVNEWSVCFKNEMFEHEKEVRLICYVPQEYLNDNNLNEDFKKFRTTHGIIIPYIDILLKKDCLKSVTIGPLIEVKIAKDNLNIFLAGNGYSNIEIFLSSVPIRY